MVRLSIISVSLLFAAQVAADPIPPDRFVAALRDGVGSSDHLHEELQQLGLTVDFGEEVLGDQLDWPEPDPHFWNAQWTYYSEEVTSGPPPVMVDCTAYGEVTWAAYERGEVLKVPPGYFYPLSDTPPQFEGGFRLECSVLFASLDPAIHPSPEQVVAFMEQAFSNWTHREIGDSERFQGQRVVNGQTVERLHVSIGTNASGGPATDFILIAEFPSPMG